MLRKTLLLFFIFTFSSWAISLEQAIQLGLQNNKRILIQEAEFDSTTSFIKEARGLYDTYLNTEISFEDSILPSTSAFAKNNILINLIFLKSNFLLIHIIRFLFVSLPETAPVNHILCTETSSFLHVVFPCVE